MTSIPGRARGARTDALTIRRSGPGRGRDALPRSSGRRRSPASLHIFPPDEYPYPDDEVASAGGTFRGRSCSRRRTAAGVGLAGFEGMLAARPLRRPRGVGHGRRRRVARRRRRRAGRLPRAPPVGARPRITARARFYERRGWRRNGDVAGRPLPAAPIDLGIHIREEPERGVVQRRPDSARRVARRSSRSRAVTASSSACPSAHAISSEICGASAVSSVRAGRQRRHCSLRSRNDACASTRTSSGPEPVSSTPRARH